MGQQGKGTVYFIQTQDGRFVKIGYSAEPIRRMSQLGTLRPSSYALEMLGWIPGTRETEGWLHQKFQADRDNGEWFRDSEALRNFISVLGLITHAPESLELSAVQPLLEETAEETLEETAEETPEETLCFRPEVWWACVECGQDGSVGVSPLGTGPSLINQISGYHRSGSPTCSGGQLVARIPAKFPTSREIKEFRNGYRWPNEEEED